MKRAFGINELIAHNFKHRVMSEAWQKHIGNIETNSTILIRGKPKNGKTDYCIKLCKELALNGAKVFYNSYEQGKSETLKQAIVRNNMQEVSGKVMFGDREPFDDLMIRMKQARSGNVLVIDSWDYMNLSKENFVYMRELLKRKMIIIICWADGNRALCRCISRRTQLCCYTSKPLWW
jgi:archaellum biogenesis ATPase FlaH